MCYINIIPSLDQKYVNRLNGFGNDGFYPGKCIMKIRAFAYLQVNVKYYDFFNFFLFFTQIYQENFLKN